MSMRLAIFHNLPSGGAKRTLYEAVRRLAARHHVDVYTLSSADHSFGDVRGLVSSHHVLPFSPLPLLRSPLGRLNQAIRAIDLSRLDKIGRQAARQIDNGHYDAVLVHPCAFEQAPSVLRHLAVTPSVYYCHESNRLLYEPMPARPRDDQAVLRRRVLNVVDPLPAYYRRRLRSHDQRNLRAAGSVLVNSRFTAHEVARIYGAQAEVCYHGVDVEYFRPMGLGRRPFVLSVGSLTRLKGFDFLIEALASYPFAGRPALVVASNFEAPGERRYLEELARERDVSLTLLGSVTDTELVRLYGEATAVAYAPLREPFGLVPLEAMACATPVVAVAEGGIPESVVHGETGLLTPRSPSAFAAALEQVFTVPTLARRLGQGGREQVVRAWTWDMATARVEAYLAAAKSRREDARHRAIA